MNVIEAHKKSPVHPIIIHVIEDGKPGHISQLKGLLHYINELIPVRIEFFNKASLGEFSEGQHASPDIVLGAGHTTHLPLLKHASAHKAFSVVLMKPSLPNRLFDAVICPEHDRVKASDNIFKTRGTINKVILTPEHTLASRSKHLMLLGGPSKHYQWNNAQLVQQIEKVCSKAPSIDWLAFTSRRTPETFTAKLKAAHLNNLIIEEADCSTLNLEEQLLQSRFTWVSPDSLSMLYEALTSGGQVGIFSLKTKRRPKSLRIEKSTQMLVEQNTLTSFEQWLNSDAPLLSHQSENQAIFCEAKRAANWLVDRYLRLKNE